MQDAAKVPAGKPSTARRRGTTSPRAGSAKGAARRTGGSPRNTNSRTHCAAAAGGAVTTRSARQGGLTEGEIADLGCKVRAREPRASVLRRASAVRKTLTSMLALLVMMLIALPGLTGCAAWIERPPIETVAHKLLDEAIVPALREGLAQGVSAHQAQLGVQGINPKYVVRTEGYWKVGIDVLLTIGADGVAGQLQTATQGGDRTVTSPHQGGARSAPDAVGG